MIETLESRRMMSATLPTGTFTDTFQLQNGTVTGTATITANSGGGYTITGSVSGTGSFTHLNLSGTFSIQ